MRVYHDEDADLSILKDRKIAVIGYGNQGRSQALNLRDSGLNVLVGNIEDDYATRAREDKFPLHSIAQAANEADIVMLLIPDEVTPHVFEQDILPHLGKDKVMVFASGYNIAFGAIDPPPEVDVVLVAPRMIGAGVRDHYVSGQGFPSFIGVAQDASGNAKEIALAIAKGIGSTRAGVVEVTFTQEAELDLFTEQCFGPAFGHVLTTAVDVLLDAGYPPEAVLLELYMSGEFSYTLGKIAELGIVEQAALHSRTSQYGSMSRGMRFMLPELRVKMEQGLEEITSGKFAEEWEAEQAAGSPTLEMLKSAARSLPLYQLEQELRQVLRFSGPAQLIPSAPTPMGAEKAQRRRILGRALKRLRGLVGRRSGKSAAPTTDTAGNTPSGGDDTSESEVLNASDMTEVLQDFIARAVSAPALQTFAKGKRMTTHYVLPDMDLEFYMQFDDGHVTTGMGAPATPAEVRIETSGETLDGMFAGRVNAMRAAMRGKIKFSGDAKAAMGIQRIQNDLCELYTTARSAYITGK